MAIGIHWKPAPFAAWSTGFDDFVGMVAESQGLPAADVQP